MIYLDNAATTPLKKEVLDKMMPYLTENYFNASSFYNVASKTKVEIDNAREQVAKLLNAEMDEIYFTSGGTESDNWALKGFAMANKHKGKHIITSQIEHHAILHSCEYLETLGFEITRLKPDEDGIISPESLKEAMREDTIIVSIMFANNEIGTIEPIKELAEVANEKGIIFHTDAVQAVGHVPIDVKDLGVNMLSLSGHKFGGPKGIGALYIKRGTLLHNFMHGGAQERARRAGTENVAGVIGLAEALKISVGNIEKESKRLKKLQDKLIKIIEKEIPNAKLNGHREKRLANNINFSFEFIEGEGILIFLDLAGICASSGSACTSGSLDPSHVLLSIGLPHELAHGSLRLSLGEDTTEEDVDYTVDKLKEIVERLRQMSPLYEG